MRIDEFHIGILTVENSSGFMNHFCVSPVNPCGP